MLQENILYAFAAFERRNTRVKAMNGMRARLYDGHRPFGLVPIGYMRQKEGKNSMVVIHPTKGQLVKEALEMYALRHYLEKADCIFMQDLFIIPNEILTSSFQQSTRL